jgi:hypothetical protein
MNSKQLFEFIKSQLPMLPHIHAELDSVQKELDACHQAPAAPPVSMPPKKV